MRERGKKSITTWPGWHPARVLSFLSARAKLVRKRSWTVAARATIPHRGGIPRPSAAHMHVCTYACIRVARRFFPLLLFFSTVPPVPPAYHPRHGRDAFSNRWWPTAAFFSPSPALPPFLFFAFLQVRPLSAILLSRRCSIHFSAGPASGRPLSLPVSTLFHLIKGHKARARPPCNYDDHGDGE